MKKLMVLFSAVAALFALACVAPAEEDSGSRKDGGTTDARARTDANAPHNTGSSTTCTLEQIYSDQAASVCGADQYCGVTTSYTAACEDNASAGGTVWGTCDSSNPCPIGTTCVGITQTEGQCWPWCSEAHPVCPQDTTGKDTFCGFFGPASAPTSFLAAFCSPQDTCDPAAATGCTSGEACFLVAALNEVVGTLCYTAGTTALGASCTSLVECVPGSICWGEGTSGTCTKMCHASNTECTSGTCNAIGTTGYGYCGTAATDGGSVG